MKIGIFYKKENPEIINLLKSEASKHQFEIDNDNPDVVFSVGGDGTFLRAVHKYINALDKIRFVGINTGSLGFFYDYSKEEIASIMNELESNSCSYNEHPLLKGEVTFKNSKDVIYALNEIRIENPFHTLISDVLVNDEKLETYRGNGLIVSSTLGSSAYNKSLGGALIDSDINALELTEIAAIQNNVYRSLGSSLVVKGDKVITFSGNLNNTVVGYDHLNFKKDDDLLKVRISTSDKNVKIIYSKDHSYIQRIRKSFVL